MTLNRVFTLVVFMGALVFVSVLLPRGAEAIDYGVLSPITVPKIYGYLIAALAAGQLFTPDRNPDIDLKPTHLLRAGVLLALTVRGVRLMLNIGFLPVSISLAAAASLLMGERRPFWLCLSIGVLPVAIWLLVTVVLSRNLP